MVGVNVPSPVTLIRLGNENLTKIASQEVFVINPYKPLCSELKIGSHDFTIPLRSNGNQAIERTREDYRKPAMTYDHWSVCDECHEGKIIKQKYGKMVLDLNSSIKVSSRDPSIILLALFQFIEMLIRVSNFFEFE